MTIVYQDINGHTVHENVTDIQNLSTEGVAKLIEFTSHMPAAKEAATQDFIQGLDRDFGEWLTSPNENHAAFFAMRNDLIFGNMTGTVDGQTFLLKDIVDSLVAASNAIGNFISNQVDDATKWFTSADGANIAFAQWLGQNMQGLVNGDLDTADAFIDLAQFIALQYGAHELSEFLNGAVNEQTKQMQFTAAHELLSETVFQDYFGVDKASADALTNNISTALTRFAVDFVAHANDWDSDDYLAAGIMTTTSVIAQYYAQEIFSRTTVDASGVQIIGSSAMQSANVSGTVAAVANIVSTLLADHNLNTSDWIKLGATTGLAFGSAALGQLTTKALTATLGLGGANVVGVAAGFALSFLGGKILEGIFGSKKYYAGEFADPVSAMASLYAVKQIDSGNGTMVNALVATNPKGSTLILQKGIIYAVGGTGSDTLVGDGGGVKQDNVLSGNGGDD